MDLSNIEYSHTRDELGWNNDPQWIYYVESLRTQIGIIATKFTMDDALREDAVQNAILELLHQYPEQVRGFEDYVLGNIEEERWQEILKSFCLTVARNDILSTLSSHTTGNIYVGRTHVSRSTDATGVKRKVKTHIPARYVSLDQLVSDSGLQISEHGDLSWVKFNEVGNAEENH